MGGLLTHPRTEKESRQGEGPGFKYGISSMQGWRPTMEDAHDIKIGLEYGLSDWSYFAVFDGHAGELAATFAAANLLDFILKDERFQLDTSATKSTTTDFALATLIDTLKVGDDSSLPSSKLNSEGNSDVDGQVEATNHEHDRPESESQPVKSQDSTNEHANEHDGRKQQNSNDQSKNDSPPKTNFHERSLSKQLQHVHNAIYNGFLNIDEKMRVSSIQSSGCTALCTLISPTNIFVANCGDSRAVLRNKSQGYRLTTQDHKPFHEVEKKRIIEAGGSVSRRINGTLAVSRALGDFQFKKDENRGQCEQLVSPEPEITEVKRLHDDQILILACDGIWDVMTCHEICSYVLWYLEREKDLEKICSSVLDLCLHKGSQDNMSMILIVFEGAPEYSEAKAIELRESDSWLVEKANLVCRSMVRGDGMSFETFIFELEDLLRIHRKVITPETVGIVAKYTILKDIFERRKREVELCDKEKDLQDEK